MKNNVIKQTHDWLEVSELPCATKQECIDKVELIKKLVIEELNETIEGIKNDDLDEIYNGLSDSYTVLSNLPYYLSLDLKELDKEIGRTYLSNLTKYCDNKEDAEITKEMYASGMHPNKPGKIIEVDVYENEFEGKTVYYLKNKEGKIMKSWKFKDVNEF